MIPKVFFSHLYYYFTLFPPSIVTSSLSCFPDQFTYTLIFPSLLLFPSPYSSSGSLDFFNYSRICTHIWRSRVRSLWWKGKLSKGLKFSLERSFISLVEFVPRYFIVFDIIVNSSVFTIWFSVCLLLVYNKAIDWQQQVEYVPCYFFYHFKINSSRIFRISNIYVHMCVCVHTRTWLYHLLIVWLLSLYFIFYLLLQIIFKNNIDEEQG